MANRYDIGVLSSPRKLPDGRMVVDAKLTRTGVFEYMNQDGSTRREYRSPSEVFDAISLATFAHASVTNNHPIKMVSAENAASVTVGIVAGSVRQMDDHVAAELVIFDAKSISDIEAGKLELSCGYEAIVTDAPGISPENEKYDSVQSNIRINHVAIVDVGRAGPEARIHMDGAYMVPGKTPTLRETMNLDQALLKVAELEKAKLVEEVRADSAETALTAITLVNQTLEAERDAAREDSDKADKLRADSDDGFDAKVAERVKLISDAKSILPEIVLDAKSDLEIQEECLKETGFERSEKHSDAYVMARFDIAVANSSDSLTAHNDMREGVVKVGTHLDADAREKSSRDRMLERQLNAHKGSN